MSCKKLIDIPPSTSDIATDNVFTNDASAIAALTGIYSKMSSPYASFTGSSSITHLTSLSSDELTLYAGYWVDPFLRYYQNDLIMNSQFAYGGELWSPLYNYAFSCNAAIEGLSQSKALSLSPAVKQQLMGEAKFLRGLFYFYLTNLFGKIPLALTTDYKINTNLKRIDESIIYAQIVSDLKDAESLLSEVFLDHTVIKSTSERVRPTRWAAKALLARVYLYQKDYTNAELKTTEIIDHQNLFTLTELGQTFLKNSREAIWQIQPTSTGFNTSEATSYVLVPDGPWAGEERSTYLSSQLLSSFESADQRRNGEWVDSVTVAGITYYYSYKYKQNTYNPDVTSPSTLSEYLTVLRLGEQYLIRAEARAWQNKLTGANSAQSDIDAIRTRAGLPGTTATNQPEMLAAIEKERQTELFLEFGHRWFDLKITGRVDAVMSTVTPLKGGSWQPTDKLYPIPLSDLQKAPNLDQNEGYK